MERPEPSGGFHPGRESNYIDQGYELIGELGVRKAWRRHSLSFRLLLGAAPGRLLALSGRPVEERGTIASMTDNREFAISALTDASYWEYVAAHGSQVGSSAEPAHAGEPDGHRGRSLRQDPVQRVQHRLRSVSQRWRNRTTVKRSTGSTSYEFRHFRDAFRGIFKPARRHRVTFNLSETPRSSRQLISIMSYRYEFDRTGDGDLRLRRGSYEILQSAYRGLRDELEAWNSRAVEHGGSTPPYEQEVEDLNSLLAWGDKQLAHTEASEIVVRGISIASSRYAKAALTLAIHRRREDREAKSQEGWPDAALRSLDESIDRIGGIADIYEHEPSDVLWQLIPKPETREQATPAPIAGHWDVFISHAGEDKEDFVRPLAQALSARGLSIWFDELTLTVGDNLRRSIDRGLARSRFGVVVISPHFLNKVWPQRELDGLVAREVDGTKVILPVWHNITAEQLRARSPMLADRMAAMSSNGIDRVVDDLARAIAAGTTTTATC